MKDVLDSMCEFTRTDTVHQYPQQCRITLINRPEDEQDNHTSTQDHIETRPIISSTRIPRNEDLPYEEMSEFELGIQLEHHFAYHLFLFW